MEIDKKLYSDIKDYCKMNGLKTGEYINSLLKEAFIKDKFGETPFQTLNNEHHKEIPKVKKRIENKSSDNIEKFENEGNLTPLISEKEDETEIRISEPFKSNNDAENKVANPKRRRLN